MTYDHEKEFLYEDSDGSENVNEKDKKSNRSIFSDRIAKDLINSHDKVDQRLLKLHKFTTGPTQKTDKMGYFGVKDILLKSLTSKMMNRKPDLVTEDGKQGEKPKLLLQNILSNLRSIGP